MSDPAPMMSTPPGTTLSTPSPTELHDQDPIAAETEKAAMSGSMLKHIYLIVATTPVRTSSGQRRLGIGLNGKLPWPMIKADMNYFKLVTRDGSSSGEPHGLAGANTGMISNTVIMGRKTWASIPPSFRPLSHRVNVIVTRSKPFDVATRIVSDLYEQKKSIYEIDPQKRKDLDRRAHEDRTSVAALRLDLASAEEFEAVGNDNAESVVVRSLPAGKLPEIVVESDLEAAVEHCASKQHPGEVYCIGGAEVYAAFLKNDRLRSRLRILQTEIVKTDGTEFECDTYWPEDPEDEQSGWKEVGTPEVHAWTGIDTPQGPLKTWAEDEKVGVNIRVRGWQPTSG